MGVLIAFAVMIVLVYRKVPLALAGVIAGVVMCLLSGLDVLGTMKGDFMMAAANFVKSWFLLFLLCAIYAAAMDASGAAYSLGKWLAKLLGAKYALWGVSLAAFVLTYGGISCFVIVFAMYPIALVMFKEADISRNLIPAAIGAGAFLAPNVMIGSPAICNIIPTEALGTTPMAAPMVSIICSIVLYVSANIYVILRNKSNHKRGIGFVPTEKIIKTMEESESRQTVHPLLASLPLFVIILTLNVLKFDVLIAVVCGIVAAYALFWKRIDDKLGTFITGTQTGINSVMTVAPAVGLGSVVKATAIYGRMIDLVTNMSGSPLISWAIASAALSCITSSGSGAEAILNATLAPTYLSMGMNPEILHRITTTAILGTGNTPWNGTMCVTMAACDLTHKEAYLDILGVTLIPTILATIVSVGLGIMFY
ncbi:MAG: hypothetical protein RRY09_01880 [Oscillospiraceae bacterium]